MRAQLTLLVTLLALLPSLVGADPVTITRGDCESTDPLTLGLVTITTGDITFYVDDRGYAFGDGLWVWQETNHQDGLQRGGPWYVLPPDEPPAWGWACDFNDPDQVVY